MSLADAIRRIDQLAVQLAPAQAAPTRAQTAGDFGQVLTQATKATPGGAGYSGAIDAAAARHGVDPALVRSVVQQESGFNPNATSPAGAAGLMQLMPATAQSLGVTNPYDPQQSLDGGTRYLRSLLDKFGGDRSLALAAYNAGPGAVEHYGGVPPYPETQQYVADVLGRLGAS